VLGDNLQEGQGRHRGVPALANARSRFESPGATSRVQRAVGPVRWVRCASAIIGITATQGTTVRQLIDAVGPKLRLLTGSQFGGRLIRGSHVSDLRHPARYLLPGELVLTNGLWLGRAATDEWVQEVAAVGAVAVLFGLSGEHATTPQGLVDACKARRLPLLEASEDTSFVDLTNQIVLAIGDPATVARRQLDQHRRLREIIHEGGDREALIAFLHRETGLELGLYSVDGNPLAVFGRTVPGGTLAIASRLAVQRLLPADIGDDYSGFETPGSALGSLLIVAERLGNIDDEDRAIIEQVVTFAAVQDERERADDMGRRVIMGELVVSLWTDEISDNILAYKFSRLGLDSSQDCRVIASELPITDMANDVQACYGSGIVAPLEHWSVALVPANRDEQLENFQRRLQDHLGHPSHVGVGAPRRGAAGLRESLVEAVSSCLLANAADAGGSATKFSYRSLLGLVPPQITQAFAKAVLGRVHAWDEKHRSELMTTLACFVKHEWRLQVTATDLGIHQNTLRFRLDRIAQLSNRHFDSAQDRIDLAIAVISFR